MSNIILNIVISLLVIIPMGYFMFGGSKNKTRRSAFKNSAAQLNIFPDKIGLWQDGAIGLDKKQNTLVYTSSQCDGIIQSVQLDHITHCDLKKYYHTEKVHYQDIRLLKAISLELKTKQKDEIKIPVYSAEVNPGPEDDLLEAMEWTKIINTSLAG